MDDQSKDMITSFIRQLPPSYFAELFMHRVSPPRTCGACGKSIPVGSSGINIIATIGSPGHPELSPLNCPEEEHWACSPECWTEVAHACIDNHLLPRLKAVHDRLNGKG